MQKRSSTGRGKQGPEDTNEIAFRVMEAATGQVRVEDNGKNAAAVELGRLGGLKGGRARAQRLTAEQRSEIARHAEGRGWRSH